MSALINCDGRESCSGCGKGGIWVGEVVVFVVVVGELGAAEGVLGDWRLSTV